MRSNRFRPCRPLDLARTLAPLRQGAGDPCTAVGPGGFWRATRTPEGPATLRLRVERRWAEVVADAWGPGADWAVAHAPELVGAGDDGSALGAAVAGHPLLRALARRHPGVRLPRTLAVHEALVAAICAQKVTSVEARRAWRAITRRWGEPAPGAGDAPAAPALLLPAAPDRLAGLTASALHPAGLERKRAETVLRTSRVAASLEAAGRLPWQQAEARLRAVDGVGPWTAAEVARVALGAPDAVSVGDYHVPSLVTFALAGDRDGTDERMLELLEPFRPQRGRVQRLLEVGGVGPPRRAPRTPPRHLPAI